jgi:GcrA cell cycle regulator
MQSSDWAEEHSQALRDYLAKGLSFSEIAKAINARFSTAYSRNATIGRARRMGLDGPRKPDRPARPKRQPKPESVRLKKLRARVLTQSRPKPLVGERAAALKLRCVGIMPRHLSLLELEAGDCRYPYGGDAEGEAITFCGHPRCEGSSYCLSHFHLTRGPGTASEGSAVKVSLRLVEAA